MKGFLRESGSCIPELQTARRNAIAAGKVMIDLLTDEDFADICVITLDWEGDGITPVVEFMTVKWMPQYAPQNLQHIWPLDMNEVFGQDNIDNALLRQIIKDIEYAMRAEIKARERAPERKARIEI